MNYQLRTAESLGEGVRRVCRRQIQLAIAASRSERSKNESAVHRTRKHLKKARAALRLLEGVAGRDEFAWANRNLRNVARLVSDVRDAEVRYQTVQHLGDLLQIENDKLVREAEAFLGLELESFLAAFSDWNEEAVRQLNRVRRSMKDWEVEKLTCKQIRRTVLRAYRRGRRTLRKAMERPTAEHFHAFRKDAKELTYQLRVLSPLQPMLVRQLVSELEVLTKHLGDAHDLAFLEERLIKHTRRGRDDHGASALSELIGLREKELQRTAAALGENFYAERPKAFAHRISEYFEAWEMARRGDNSPVKEFARTAVELNGREM